MPTLPTIQNNATSRYQPFILLFVFIKIGFSILLANHYGFHRDELLHLTLGDHLDWGYMEVPPLIALLAKASTAFFGDAVYAARIFPALASALMVWFTGLLVVEMGGKRFAITLACLCLIFSPGMAASCYLFQPVVFDQLWWLLAAYLTIKYVNTRQATYLYLLGVVVGLGLLTKYTMAFFTGALLLGIVLTPQRRLLWRQEMLIAISIAALLFLPNLVWQYQHHWPVVTHMNALKQQQLNYVKPIEFVIQQLMMHGISVVIWIVGLCGLLFSKALGRYRCLAFAYLLVFAFLLKMSGKAYYLLAAYPMLFAAGGVGLALFIKNYVVRTATAFVLIAPNLMLLPVVLPVFSMQQALGFFDYYHRHMPFMDFAVTWEDQKKHRTTQDYADMLGWDEMARKTAAIYHSLSPKQQKQTVLFADNYGEAGALHVYGKHYRLPDVVCLNSSFALWAPPNFNAKYMIYISDDNNVSDLQAHVQAYKRIAIIENSLAREYGTGIFLLTNLKPSLNAIYHRHWQKNRLEAKD